MALTEYHLKYINLPKENIDFGLRAKEFQLRQVLEKINWQPLPEPVKIAILGCADKRFVAGHKLIFEKIFNRDVNITTFDTTIEHLRGEENIIEHDCAKPLPNGPFDLIFSHILLKFMPADQQWQVLGNSFQALKAGGIALHFMDVEGKTVPTSMISEGFYEVFLNEFKNKLKQQNIRFSNLIIKSETGQSRELECLVLFK